MSNSAAPGDSLTIGSTSIISDGSADTMSVSAGSAEMNSSASSEAGSSAGWVPV